MIDCTVDNLEAVFGYMDDSRVSPPDGQTHLINLEAYFSVLTTNGLEKSVFTIPTLEILGHTISATGLAPTDEHTAAIDSCPPPFRISSSCKDFSAW
jgi:hypothetical protein